MKTILHISKTVIFLLCSALLLSGCTIEKRHFMSGYYIDWKNNKSTALKNPDEQKNEVVSIKTEEINKDVLIIASNENNTVKPTPFSTEEPRKQYCSTQKELIFSEFKNNAVKVTEFPLTFKKQTNSPSRSGEDFPGWAYIIIALLIPPLAVAIKYGFHAPFWLCLLFTLLGWLPGVIYAIVYHILKQGE